MLHQQTERTMGNGHTTYRPAKPNCGKTNGDIVMSRLQSHLSPIPLPAKDPTTERSRTIWGSGDFDRIAAGFREDAAEFVSRRELAKDQKVLDVACGSGNLTIPAARTGAAVTGLDLIPSLLKSAAAWAINENLDISLDEGNAEELPYDDESFDVVLSMFGLMFAARQERIEPELRRVVRRGGQIALANWVRSGFVGEMLNIHTSLVAPPPGLQSPLRWGDPKVLRSWFRNQYWSVSFTPRVLTFRYKYTPAGIVELFRKEYGPTVRAFASLDEDGRAELNRALVRHWQNHATVENGITHVKAEYLEVVATRR